MNTILQKRIEEAAHQYIQSDAVAPENMQLAFGDFINGAKWVLQNQWISVEEMLPEKEGRYLCNYHYTMSNSDDECDCVDFGLFKDGKWYIGNNEVTHWMPIPSLEGGEE